MANITAGLPAAPSRAAAGIVSILFGMMLFVVQDGMMKSLLGPLSMWVLILARGVMALIVLVPVIWVLGGPHRLLTPLWPIHLLRASFFTSGFALFYTAFPLMGLAEVTTIFFAAPLIVALMAAVWLGERIGPHRLGALIVGFAGVVIAMNPAGENFQWAAVLPLSCAFLYATSQILARKIGDRETSLTTGLYTVAFSGVLILPLGWAVNQVFDFGPEFAHLRWDLAVARGQLDNLMLLGLVGLGGYILLSRAYQIAPASLVAPFDYCYLPMATIMAWAMWDEVPGIATIAGMVLIIASGLYLGARELRQSRKATVPAPTAEASFAPSNPQAAMTLHADIINHRTDNHLRKP